MSFSFSYRSYRREFRKPLRTSRGEWSIREGFILRLEGEKGVHFGEIAPIPEFGTETLAEAAAFLERLVADPALADDPAVLAKLPCCAFAVSAAQKKPVASGQQDEIAALLPAGAAALAVAKSKTASGHSTFKWKIGVLPVQDEINLFKQLVDQLPASAKIRVDANASLNEGDLVDWLRAVQAFRAQLDYFEQPLSVGEEAVMGRLSEEFGVPIALDESLNGSVGARWLERGAWAGPLVVKPLLMGNMDELVARLLPLASQVTLSSVFETGVGLSNVRQLMAELPGLVAPLGFDTLEAFDDDLAKGAELTALSTDTLDMESIWKQLPHSN